ncbi:MULTISPECIES: hypothetical protein [Bacillus]|uniref:hypothetical protein n=1 Tax=Bacillus TaxID=1386 RepID=UPI000BA8BA3F|nr:MULTISPECIES: hypothetical protein [Bacillus]MBU2661807.1 hypothetical protein [Bacillus cabrialesii]PAO69915.1 hypothetical protein CIK44_04140 [Bacillus sp. X2(2017)]
MLCKTDVTLIIENGNEKSQHTFENEMLNISRATTLWIENAGEGESDFIETVKNCHQIDLRVGSMSRYTIKTSNETPIQQFRVLYVKKIEDDAITFEWIGY